MEKSIIITGPRHSGKSKKAKELAEEIVSREGGHIVYFHRAANEDIFKNKYIFGECTIDTKVIVVDCIGFDGQLESFFNAVTNGVFVIKKGYAPYLIYPIFIIVLVPGINMSFIDSHSFQRRFDIVSTIYEKAITDAKYIPFLGNQFISWADEWLNINTTFLNTYVHFRQAYEIFCQTKTLQLSPNTFRNKMALYCEWKGWLLNPKGVKYLDEDGRIFIKTNYKPVYNHDLNLWELLPVEAMKIFEFFYIQTPEIELTNNGLGQYMELSPQLNNDDIMNKKIMEELTIKGKILFEFRNYMDWVNNAPDYFAPYKYGYSKVALDKNNNVCHIGEDFMYARDNKLFPVKVYALQRSVDSLINS